MLTGESPATEEERQELASLWGIDWPHWPWTTRIRILVVIDGRITEGTSGFEFGLGPDPA